MFVFGQGCFFGVPGGGGGVAVDTGDMLVGWSFSGGSLCPVDVERVVIEVRDGAGSKVFDDVVTSCDDVNRRFNELGAGNYFVRMKGLDIDDEITWESTEQNILVEPAAVADVTINMFPL